MPSDWKSHRELRSKFQTQFETDDFCTLFALNRILIHAFYPKGFQAPSEFADLVIPSRNGIELLNDAATSLDGIPKPDVHLALFGLFFHTDILVDYRGIECCENVCDHRRNGAEFRNPTPLSIRPTSL